MIALSCTLHDKFVRLLSDCILYKNSLLKFDAFPISYVFLQIIKHFEHVQY